MSKAQLHTQVLVYVLALIITSLILIYGYKAVADLIKMGETASWVEFCSNLDSEISGLSHDFGSIKSSIVDVPGGYQSVCFADLSTNIHVGIGDYPIIEDSVEGSNSRNNVFLWPDGTKTCEVANLTVQGGFMCFDVTGDKIHLKLEGKGNKVRIS